MKMKSIAALSIVGLMALQMPVTAYASVDAAWVVDPTPATQEHAAIDTTTEFIGVHNNNVNVSATVNGDVKLKSKHEAVEGIVNRGANSSITVLGDISVENTGTSGDTIGIDVKEGNAEANNITVTGNKNTDGIIVRGNSSDVSVTVNNDISVTTTYSHDKVSTNGIWVRDPYADVTISAQKIHAISHASEGDAAGIDVTCSDKTNSVVSIECTGIDVTADWTACAVQAFASDDTKNEVNIKVNGSITGDLDNGLQLGSMGGKTIVTIDSDITAKKAGMLFELAKGTGSVSVAVNGTVSGDEAAIFSYDTTADNYDVSVYGLKTSATGKLANDDAALARVNYIVHGNDGSADYKNMTFDPAQVSTVTVNGKTYYTAKEGTITVTVGSGYTLKSTQGIAGSGNTYTVTIPQGGFVTLEAILAAVEQEESNEEQKPVTTGNIGAPVTNGVWNLCPGGIWTYRTNGLFKNTWAYIGNPYANAGQAKEGWFYFDKNGAMLTGWQQIEGKWYYFNETKDGTLGMLFVNTTTPDGYKVGADGALIQ